jgi:hypothetical protein
MPRVIPKQSYEDYRDEKQWQNARERLAEIKDKLPCQVTTDEIADWLVKLEDSKRFRRELDEERRQADKPIYGPGSSNSFFRDFVADALARKNQQQLDFHPVSAGKPIPDDNH